MTKAKLYRIGNQEKTLRQWLEYYGQPRCRVVSRLNSGWDLKEALETPKHVNDIKLTIGNVTRTLKNWAKVTGISYRLIRSRYQRGYSPEEIIAKRRGRTAPLIEAWGRSQTLAEWSREIGVNKTTLHHRLFRAKVPPEQALTTSRVLAGYDNRLTAFGRTQSIDDWAREMGINKLTLKSRLYKGLPPEIALKAPVAKRDKNLGAR